LTGSARGGYNARVVKSRNLPSTDRISVLAATILLSYALARFINLPGREISFELAGIYLAFEINARTFVALLVAGLTATGADWLLREHPRLGHGSTLEHWLLPALTAWVIGLPLFQIPLGPLWWIGFGLGAGLLMVVLVAEYIVVDPDDLRQPAASVLLTAVSFALFMMLAVALRYANLRLVELTPALALAVGLVSLRTLHLRLHGKWAFMQAGFITFLVVQFAAGLHYWPLSPISFGLAVLGLAYALTSLIANLMEGEPLRRALVEPGLILGLVWMIAIWTR
jgi:hypothetical protein